MGGFSGALKGLGAGAAAAAGNESGMDWQLQQMQRKQAMGDQFAIDNVKQLDIAIAGIQSNPYLSPDEKSGRIRAAQAEKLKWMTPMMGKQRVKQILASSPELAPFKAQTGAVPAEQVLQLSSDIGQQDQQVPFTEAEIASSGGAVGKPSSNAIQVPSELPPDLSGIQVPPMELPGKQATQVSLTPPTTADVLASGAPSDQFIDVTDSTGNRYRLPAKLAIPLVNTKERNAGAMERTQANIGAKPGQWKLQVGTKNGEPYAYYHSEAKNKNTDLNGNELEDADLRDFVAAGKGALKETIVPDPASPTGYAKIAYDTMTGVVHSKQLNVLPPRGFIASDSISTDNFGNQIVTHRQPEVPGVGGTPPRASASAAPTSAPPHPQTSQATPPQVAQPQAGEPPKSQGAIGPMRIRQHLAQQVGGQTEQPQVGGTAGLDENGHIRLQPGMNAQVVQFANRILDGADLKDIPSKAQAPAQQMAGQYGWKGQGFLTPKDQMMVRQSENLLRAFATSPSLSVLDNGLSRNKIAQVLKNPEKRTMLGGVLQERAAASLTPQEQEFVTLYNQAVGRIAGLSQLVRPGSRTTEAQIERLKSELPNPLTTTSAAHARQKFAMIQNEIDTAKQKGQFSDMGPSSGGSIGIPQVGQKVTLKDGRTVTIKAIHDDGTFDAE